MELRVDHYFDRVIGVLRRGLEGALDLLQREVMGHQAVQGQRVANRQGHEFTERHVAAPDHEDSQALAPRGAVPAGRGAAEEASSLSGVSRLAPSNRAP